MVRVKFVSADGEETLIDAEAGMTLMEVARNNGVKGIVAECGGACSCSTCHVYVRSDWLSQLSEMKSMEGEMLEFAPERDMDRSRLSCQITITEQLDGLEIDIPSTQL